MRHRYAHQNGRTCYMVRLLNKTLVSKLATDPTAIKEALTQELLENEIEIERIKGMLELTQHYFHELQSIRALMLERLRKLS